MPDEWNEKNDLDIHGHPENVPPYDEDGAFHDGPEPPIRWKPEESDGGEVAPEAQSQQSRQAQRAGMAVIGSTRFELRADEVREFESARRTMIVAQVVAVLSLFLGGIMLSAFALICAFYANKKLNALAMASGRSAEAQKALKRSGALVIATAGIALLLNVLAVLLLYPYIADLMQSGSLGSLIASPQSGATGNTTWG